MGGPRSLTVRREGPADREAVHEVNSRAFETDLEARLVDALRSGEGPAISLVAVLDGRVVGHALFTGVTVEESPSATPLLALGPMAVLPEHQRQGIGSALVREGLEACRVSGAGAVFVLGHAEYYPRFGFELASRHGLRFGDGSLAPYFMALELVPGTLRPLAGEVRYRPEFYVE